MLIRKNEVEIVSAVLENKCEMIYTLHVVVGISFHIFGFNVRLPAKKCYIINFLKDNIKYKNNKQLHSTFFIYKEN